MRKDQILSIVRHSLTFLGGIIVMKGLVDETMVTEIIGTITTLLGLVWGVIDKTK